MWRILRRLFALAACAFVLCAQKAALDRVWALAGRGDTAGAIRLADEIVRGNPQDADARLLYGSLLSDAGDGPKALPQLNAAVRLRPHSAEALNALGEADKRFGNAPAARGCFEKAIFYKPDFAVAHLNLGEVLLEANELRAAALQLDKAIALLGHGEDAPDARYLRAKVYAAQGDSQNAAAQLEKAVAQRPAMAEAWSDLGQARKMLQDESDALTAFERAVQVNPADAVAQYRLGAQYLAADQLEPAIEHLRRAAELNASDQSTLNALQLALRRAGKAQEAEQVRQRLAAVLRNRDKNDQSALNAVKLNNEGAQLEKAGDLKGASERYRLALSLNPDHVGIRVNYAVSLLRLGRWTEGLNELREALRRDPENPAIKAALNDALAQAPQ